MRPRQEGCCPTRLPHHWLPVVAILLGLLATAALGRLGSVTWGWLTSDARRVVAQLVSPAEENGQG